MREIEIFKEHEMEPVRIVEPFPHMEVRTTRAAPKTGEGTDDLTDDLLNGLAWAFVEPEKWRWAFRGTRTCNHPLDSSLDRKLHDRTEFGSTAVQGQDAEDYLLCQFKRAAQHCFPNASIPRDSNRLEWLALMQHYGAPTRLLDFTRSPYVASFFALEEPHEGENKTFEDCAVWAIDTEWLVKSSLHRVRELLPQCSEDNLLDSEYLSQNFERLFIDRRLVLPVSPTRSNPRLWAQQGLFLCPGLVQAGFKKNLASYHDDTQDQDMAEHVLKIIVKAHIRTPLLSELRLMNISRATLFPDLSGYSESLAHELQYRSDDEIRRSR